MQARSKTYQRFAFFMAFWMLLTSCGAVIDAHYCQKELQRISFLGKAKSCQEVREAMKACSHKRVTSCHKKEGEHTCDEDHSGEGCCKNNKHVAQLDVDAPFYIAINFTSLDAKKLLIATPYVVVNFEDVFPINIFNFSSYWPPPIIKNIRVSYQIFLC